MQLLVIGLMNISEVQFGVNPFPVKLETPAILLWDSTFCSLR